MKLFIFYFACIELVFGSTTGNPCQRSDSHVNQCILNKIQEIKSTLQIDPYALALIQDKAFVDGTSLDITLRNIIFSGGSDLRIEDLKVNLSNRNRYTLEMMLKIPHLRVQSDYNFQGSKYSLPIDTSGQSEGNFYDIQVPFNCAAHLYYKYGLEYLSVDSLTADVSIGSGDLNLSESGWSLFGGKISRYAHSHQSEVIRELAPKILEKLIPQAKKYLNTQLAMIPLQTILVD